MDDTVVVAVIGLAGGVVGAAIGAASSFGATALTRKHQREDRDALLWAEERRDVYLRFFSEAADVRGRIQARDRTPSDPGYGPMPREERTGLTAAFDEMRLIAPRDVVEPANNYVYNLCWPLPNAYAYVALSYGTQPLDMERLAKTRKLLDQTKDVVAQWERKTRAAMRENLGTGPEYDLPEPERKGESPPSGGEGGIVSAGYPTPPTG